MVKKTPVAVVIGNPDLPKGQARLSCELCKKPYPAQLSTAVTVAQSKDRPDRPMVVCWFCLKSVTDKNPQWNGRIEVAGIKALRDTLGMDPL